MPVPRAGLRGLRSGHAADAPPPPPQARARPDMFIRVPKRKVSCWKWRRPDFSSKSTSPATVALCSASRSARVQSPPCSGGAGPASWGPFGCLVLSLQSPGAWATVPSQVRAGAAVPLPPSGSLPGTARLPRVCLCCDEARRGGFHDGVRIVNVLGSPCRRSPQPSRPCQTLGTPGQGQGPAGGFPRASERLSDTPPN